MQFGQRDAVWGDAVWVRLLYLVRLLTLVITGSHYKATQFGGYRPPRAVFLNFWQKWPYRSHSRTRIQVLVAMWNNKVNWPYGRRLRTVLLFVQFYEKSALNHICGFWNFIFFEGKKFSQIDH